MTLVDAHLQRIARRLAALLRGTDDPSVYVGTPEGLTHEIQRIFDVPRIRCAAAATFMTYREAAARAVAPPPTHTEETTPVCILAEGLRGPSTLAAQPRETLAPEHLAEDLAALLREPHLRLYVRGRSQASLTDAARIAMPPGGGAIRALPMANALSLVCSFDAARTILERPEVVAWEVPGSILLSNGGRP